MTLRAIAVLLLALAGAAPAQAARSAAERALSDVARLSDERTVARSASPARAAAIRNAPSGSARVIGRLRRLTEDGYAERYLLLREGRDPLGRMWVRLRIPGRPNGRTGWVLRDALGRVRTTHAALVIDRARLRATFLLGGRARWSAPVGIGAAPTPTPAGRFWVREQFRAQPGTIYGPYAFGTAAYARISDWPGGAVVGIHGTDQPELIPGRPSHGCVRMRNADILWLAKHLPDGAPVRIV